MSTLITQLRQKEQELAQKQELYRALEAGEQVEGFYGHRKGTLDDLAYSVIPRLKRELAELEQEIEIERPEPVEIEAPAPIEVERPEPIVIDRSKLVRINAKGEPTLRARQLPKTNKEHYDSVKLPSQEKDPRAWKQARSKRLGASDLAKFTTYHKDIPALFKERIHGIEREFSEASIENMEMGNFLESRTHKRLAKSLLDHGVGKLDNFEFSEVYLSKNRQYFNYDLPSLGSQLDAWGILDGKKTIIEVKSTSQFGFEALEKALSFSGEDFQLGNMPSAQDLLHEQAPYYYYQIQAQMLTTGLTQAVLHVINRNNYKTLSVLIKADLPAFAWIERIVGQYEQVLKSYERTTPNSLEEDFEKESLGFNLDYPAPQAKAQAEALLKEKVVSLVKETPEIQEGLDELTELEKKMRSLKAKLTKKGFKDKERKVYEKLLAEEVAS